MLSLSRARLALKLHLLEHSRYTTIISRGLRAELPWAPAFKKAHAKNVRLDLSEEYEIRKTAETRQ